MPAGDLLGYKIHFDNGKSTLWESGDSVDDARKAYLEWQADLPERVRNTAKISRIEPVYEEAPRRAVWKRPHSFSKAERVQAVNDYHLAVGALGGTPTKGERIGWVARQWERQGYKYKEVFNMLQRELS